MSFPLYQNAHVIVPALRSHVAGKNARACQVFFRTKMLPFFKQMYSMRGCEMTGLHANKVTAVVESRGRGASFQSQCTNRCVTYISRVDSVQRPVVLLDQVIQSVLLGEKKRINFCQRLLLASWSLLPNESKRNYNLYKTFII